MNLNRKKISITKHAELRMMERMPDVRKKQYQQIVNTARYRGEATARLMAKYPEIMQFVKSRKMSNSTVIRLYNDFVFVFKGCENNSRTLITLYPLPEDLVTKIHADEKTEAIKS